MKTSSPAQTPEEYLSALPEPRQAELRALHEAIRLPGSPTKKGSFAL